MKKLGFIGLLALAGTVGALAVYFLAGAVLQPSGKSVERAASPAQTPLLAGSATPKAVLSSPVPSVAATTAALERPQMDVDYISFGAPRRAQMAAYSQRRYGDPSIELEPKAVVLHYTAGGTYESVWALFNANGPNGGELPGVVTHFVIAQDGTIHQLLALDLRGRHTVGLNHVAIGIEFVQDAGRGDSWATGQILHREAQITAGVELVRWLQQRFAIPTRDVLGHGTANDSRYFRDLQGRTNDHGDWGAAAMRRFHKLL